MATIIKRPSGNWKAIIRKAGWPLKANTFRTKRDAEDWARRTEDEIVRGTHIVRSTAERMTLAVALKRYTTEVTPTKRPSFQEGELRTKNDRRDSFVDERLRTVGVRPECHRHSSAEPREPLIKFHLTSNIPSGAKAHAHLIAFAAQLKSCPFKTAIYSEVP